MKFIITEQDKKHILNLYEQGTSNTKLIKITCHDYDKIKYYCESLRPSVDEIKTLITNNSANADKILLEKIDKFNRRILEMGNKESSEIKKIVNKFSTAINTVKEKIKSILSKYYPQAAYASAGLNKPINMSSIILEICDVIYNQFLLEWDKSFFEKKFASTLITKNNIEMIQSFVKDIWTQCLNEITWFCEYYFLDSTYNVIEEFYRKKSLNQKCTEVVIVQDKICNNLPKDKWSNPNKTYKLGYPIVGAQEDQEKLAYTTYLPKIQNFLNNMV